jgi:hypothetical protein
MVTIVMLRQLPGLASLGLLSALLAHTASYGSGHEAGGFYHAALLLTALAATGSFALATALLAALGAHRQGDGSILAAALRPALPGAGGLIVAASAWFTLIEKLEPHHAMVSPLLIAAALIVAAATVAAVARRAVQALASIAFSVIAGAHRERAAYVPYVFAPAPSARAVAFAYRRFARPPPV